MTFVPPIMRLGDRVEVASHHTVPSPAWQLAEVIKTLSGPEAGGMVHCRLVGVTNHTSGKVIYENCRSVDDPLVYDTKRVAGPVYRLVAERRERESFESRILAERAADRADVAALRDEMAQLRMLFDEMHAAPTNRNKAFRQPAAV